MSTAADEVGLPLPTSNESLPRKRNTLIKGVEKDYNIFDSSANSSPEMKLLPEEEQLLLRYLQDSSYSFSMSTPSTTFPSTNSPIAAPMQLLSEEEENVLFKYIQGSSFSFSFSMSAPSTTLLPSPPPDKPPSPAPSTTLSLKRPSTKPPSTFSLYNPPFNEDSQNIQPTQVPFLEVTTPSEGECCDCTYKVRGDLITVESCCGTCITTGNPENRGCFIPGESCPICKWDTNGDRNNVPCCGTCEESGRVKGCFPESRCDICSETGEECCGTCVTNGPQEGRGCFECTGSIVDVQYEDPAPDGDDQFLFCETPNGNSLKVTAANGNFINENFGKGKFKSGKIDLEFDDDATFDFANGEIRSNNKLPKIKGKKQKRCGKNKSKLPDECPICKWDIDGQRNNVPCCGTCVESGKDKGCFPEERRLQTQEVVGNCGTYLGGSCAGTRTVLVVRVEAADKNTTAEESELSDSIFGTSGDFLNLQSWYNQCSYNQLNFVPATGDGINGGVTTVQVSSSTTDGDSVMNNQIATALNTNFGVSSPNQIANHVMYCLPAGTMSGIAYANVNNWRSVYSDNWCTYVSAQAHEIGHNLVLAHSGDPAATGSALTYGDKSGMMGFSYSNDDGPMQCFNAPKNWQLGWYDDKQIAVSYDGWGGNLIGLADYGNSNVALEDMVIAKVDLDESYYVSFNRKTDINGGTQEGVDQVMVHKRDLGTGYGASDVLAYLNSGESFTSGNFAVTVNSIDLNSNPARANVNIQRFDSPPPCYTGTISITIIPDPYPGETSWDIVDEADNVVTSGDFLGVSNIELADGYYIFSIYDQYGDGMCCQYGDGSYTFQIGSTLVKTGGDFGLQESTNFGICNNVSPTTTETNAPTISPTNSPTSAPTPGPTNQPTPGPTSAPTPGPTNQPTPGPTPGPSPGPTNQPTPGPTSAPTPGPTNQPTPGPTPGPSPGPTNQPTPGPTPGPTLSPTFAPTSIPTSSPTPVPTAASSLADPTKAPTPLSPDQNELTNENTPTSSPVPSHTPSNIPSAEPSSLPSFSFSLVPSVVQSDKPSQVLSNAPSRSPSVVPSDVPSDSLSSVPSDKPSMVSSTTPSLVLSTAPSHSPSLSPSKTPSTDTQTPTVSPAPSIVSNTPSVEYSSLPSLKPSTIPSSSPSLSSSTTPSVLHSELPSTSQSPSVLLSSDPSVAPSDIPSIQASVDPSVPLSLVPSVAQSDQPSQVPSNAPTPRPSISTSSPPTGHPTSSKPSQGPSIEISDDPTTSSSVKPSLLPSNSPTDHLTSSKPSQAPSNEMSIDPTSIQPSHLPSIHPTDDPTRLKCFDQSGRPILTWKGRRRKCKYIASNKRKLCDRGDKYCANESGKLFRDYSGSCCDSCNVYYNEPRCSTLTDTSPPTIAPVTSKPTTAPVTSSPTITCKPTTIEVKLNDEINENGLMLRKYNHSTRKFSIKVYAKGRKHFNEANKTYTFDVGCLETKACYRFTFRDKDKKKGQSDGFLSGNGYVKVIYGEETIRYSKFNKPKKNLKRIGVKFGDRCPIFD
ncbi:hypothetical protein CTEN210_11693 [Chaetoceros tenuissimus]|uniref:Peptidase M11 gametolysin domain-containing protein n=1 Tax=Chaetoceros tenuissimus TaxID=426638 RepID=A0AAD3H951_9STRA|nr:hypothetical protein CTEN210_11693 [Chaetoceros tenuissimus]